MKRTILIAIAAVLTVVLATSVLMANAQQISMGDASLNVNGSPVLTAATNGSLSGEIVSASATMALSGPAVTVLTTPSTGSFILTQFCQIPGTAVLSGSSFGTIVGSGGGSEATCTSYSPGLALPQDEELVAYANGQAGHVTITGVLQP